MDPLRNFVPNSNKEQRTIGILVNKWLKGFFFDMHVENVITDETNSVTVEQLKNASDHTSLINNPHATTQTQIGLSNVPNLDTTNAVNNQHTHSNKTALDNVSGANTGDQDLSGKVDKVSGSRLITSAESILLGNTSGNNSGDQDLSNYVTKVSGKGLSTNDFQDSEKSKLDNISGTNTGDETQTTIINKIGFTPENSANKNQASGYAGLDSNSKLNPSQLPPIAIIDFLGAIANQIAMLALIGQKGDWCIRSDQSLNPMWIITGSDPTQLNSWTAVPYPAIPTLLSQLGDDSTHRLVTDTILTRLANTSGTNTGDQDLSGKVDKITGKGLSTNDYTTGEKNNLANAVPNTRTVNGKALSANISLTASDVGLPNVPNTDPTAAITSALKFEAFFNFVINGILDLSATSLIMDFNQTIIKLDLGAK
jgi:hypothetical protein